MLNQYQTQTLLLLHGAETAKAITTFPMAFYKNPSSTSKNPWQLVGIAGLTPNWNSFIQNGEWLGHYQPRSLNPDHHKADLALFERTATAIKALDAAGVLVPAHEKVRADFIGEKETNHLYILDEAALAKLGAAEFLLLHKQQALGIAYAVNLSQHQIHILQRLERMNPAPAALADGDVADADELFGEGQDDDTLKFNF